MDAQIERWRKYLRKDPTRFLLDADDNPSVYLWYLIDVAHRPEDSTAVLDARERVLYSQPVQELFAAQFAGGYWKTPDSPVEPRYKATLWTLALLAELGIPRDSRRARAACEYILQNFEDAEGSFRGVDAVSAGYLLHTLNYFNLADDDRVIRARRVLLEEAARNGAAFETLLLAAWSTQSADEPGREGLLKVLEPAIAGMRPSAPITFPPFNPQDPLFVLRILGDTPLLYAPCSARLVDWLVGKQNEFAQWPLEKSLDHHLLAPIEPESPASRWATLCAVRVIVRLVLAGEQATSE